MGKESFKSLQKQLMYDNNSNPFDPSEIFDKVQAQLCKNDFCTSAVPAQIRGTKEQVILAVVTSSSQTGSFSSIGSESALFVFCQSASILKKLFLLNVIPLTPNNVINTSTKSIEMRLPDFDEYGGGEEEEEKKKGEDEKKKKEEEEEEEKKESSDEDDSSEEENTSEDEKSKDDDDDDEEEEEKKSDSEKSSTSDTESDKEDGEDDEEEKSSKESDDSDNESSSDDEEKKSESKSKSESEESENEKESESESESESENSNESEDEEKENENNLEEEEKEKENIMEEKKEVKEEDQNDAKKISGKTVVYESTIINTFTESFFGKVILKKTEGISEKTKNSFRWIKKYKPSKYTIFFQSHISLTRFMQ